MQPAELVRNEVCPHVFPVYAQYCFLTLFKGQWHQSISLIIVYLRVHIIKNYLQREQIRYRSAGYVYCAFCDLLLHNHYRGYRRLVSYILYNILLESLRMELKPRTRYKMKRKQMWYQTSVILFLCTGNISYAMKPQMVTEYIPCIMHACCNVLCCGVHKVAY